MAASAQVVTSGLTRKPDSRSQASTSLWLAKPNARGSAMAYMKVAKSRFAVIDASFWRTLPAAALRGFANADEPASSCSPLRRSKLAFGI